MDSDRWARTAGLLRARLVRRILDAGTLRDPAWRTAFEQVPRHVFVPYYYRPYPGGRGWDRLAADDPDPRRRARWLAGAYEDIPLVTRVQEGQLVSSSSQPSLMAMMLEALEVQQGQAVLEIGTGTGYNAALLAHRLGGCAVTTVDLEEEITDAARDHLAAVGFVSQGRGRVTVLTGDGALGCHERAPFDRIMATCELASVPEAWLRQCRPGGMVLAPIADGLAALRVTDAAHAEGRFLDTPAYFVALRGSGAPPHPLPAPVGEDGRVRGTNVPPVVLDDDVFRFVLALSAGELEVSWAFGGGGVAIAAPDGSTVRAQRDGTVLVSGPRDLWAVVEDSYRLWRRERFPRRARFGVSVSGSRQWAWLDAPDGPCVWPLG
ncbi:methyltransferase domain-containing protein [Streptantibioticus rubrisoli]|uniref:Protein-L-isoaspartate O-methyltransferase n=1 Tax=Streptantibioticus rubrisoli TaxID=1387313 RepID=A0ABT1PJ86_9ACTN|nr:methyltransferase domain-containing protein [Streptantibioticus rubrisoli]MCQ4045432.1 methyltransferase domain-containing protein [Streptantibioticus rubrisoli]